MDFSFNPHDPGSWLIYLIFGTVLYWPIPVAFALVFIWAGIKKKKWLMWLCAMPFFVLVPAIIILIFALVK
jgi:hypothetical protein